jgi:ABC-type transporter Mla MlaB component
VVSNGAVYDDGVLRVTWADNPPVLALAGEIDESTYPGLVAALKEVADGHEDVHVSLAGVDYCDLAGLRAIILLTGAEGQSHNGHGPQPRRVVLHGVPSQLETVLRIVGWDSVPGLAMDGQRASQEEGRAEAGMQAGGAG